MDYSRKDHLATFSPVMITACEAALNAKIFYQDEFRDFVIHFMGGLGCEPVLLGIDNIDLGAPDYIAQNKAMRDRIGQTIKNAPRGHYIVICRAYADPNQPYRYATAMSDGKGIAIGGSHDSHDGMPSGVEIVKRMVGYEIYCCRKALEDVRRIDANIETVSSGVFYVGQEFRDYKHPGEAKRFSRAGGASENGK